MAARWTLFGEVMVTDFKFKAQDFATEHGDLLAREAAEIANAKLESWLNKAPVVYARNPDTATHPIWSNVNVHDTHEARLVDIHEIRAISKSNPDSIDGVPV